MKKGMLKKLIAVLLCFLISFGAAVPAFAMEELEDSDNREDISPYDAEIEELSNTKEYKIGKLYEYFQLKQKSESKLDEEQLEYLSVLQGFNTVAGVIQGITSIISTVNNTISFLKLLGVIKTSGDTLGSILKEVESIQFAVDEINSKTDAIRNTLVDEFADLDMRFAEQDYNHYKDDVWAKFYTDAVVPLNEYQNEYNDEVRMLLVDYIEQWQSGDCRTDLRALFGKDNNGETIQVYSGKNMGDAGDKLPRVPEVSIESIPVDFALTVPSKYISDNFDRKTALTTGNCIDKLTQALEKGVYEAAENGELTAYPGFEAEWNYLTKEEKEQMSKDFASELADALAFACTYNAANDWLFASRVKSAYNNFTKWVTGSESLTSPLYAQLKMLELTHGFEGEVMEQADQISCLICTMNVNYATFAQTVLSLSKSHGEGDIKDVGEMCKSVEMSVAADYSNFITGNPNYCYQTGKVIEYKNTNIESEMSFVYDADENNPSQTFEYKDYTTYYAGAFSSTPWVIYESGKSYPSDRETAQSQKLEDSGKLVAKSISSKEAKLIYAMYQSSGFEGSFAEYLTANNVAVNADTVTDSLVTSFNRGGVDLKQNTTMTCYLPTGYGYYYYTSGRTYSVAGGVDDELDDNNCYRVSDKVTGGLLNMKNGSSDENATFAARAFYGENKSYGGVEFAFTTTDYRSENVKITNSDTIREIDSTAYYHYVLGRNVYTNYSTFYTDDYGMLVYADPETYTFPANTKSVPDNYFDGSNKIEKIVFDGTPEEIGDNAFAGVGSPTYRCLLQAPFATGSLSGKWHGGYFGNIQITLVKNDGSDERETVVAVSGTTASSVVNPFAASEHTTFKGWSRYPNGTITAAGDTILAGSTLYAVWEYDHEHDFEVTKEAVAATCTSDGAAEERTCKTCGYTEKQTIPACGHNCEFSISGNSCTAECLTCRYYVHLNRKTLGDYTVWSEKESGDNVTFTDETEGKKSLNINESGIYLIENTDPTAVSNQRICLADGITASIGLNGVNMSVNSSDYPAFEMGNATVCLILPGSAENYISNTAGSAIKSAGRLTVDGHGFLSVSSQDECAIDFTGADVLLRRGNIRATGGANFTINTDAENAGGKLVVTENAGLYAERGTDIIPVNESGEKVYPVTVLNPRKGLITADGRGLDYGVTDPDGTAYIYLTSDYHDIRIDDRPYDYELVKEETYVERQFGDFTVLNPAEDVNAVQYASGVLTIKKPTSVTIRNTDPSVPTSDRIYVAKNVNADITLDGVSINTDDSPIKIADNSRGDVKITLAEGSVNTLKAGIECAGISKNGGVGTLTIDGSGTLNVSGGIYAPAIGSDFDNRVFGITINGGTINANAGSDVSSAIGTGYITSEASFADDVRYIVEGITINGGTINATSLSQPAIGSGYCEISDMCVKDIIINGGIINAAGNFAPYNIGGGSNIKAENIRINAGVVTAESTDSYAGNGGIGAGRGTDGLIIECLASVKADRVENPVNGAGKSVSLHITPVEEAKNFRINGGFYTTKGHNGENRLYLYLANSDKVELAPVITVEQSEYGKVAASRAVPGETVSLSAEANEGYVFKNYEISPSVEINNNTFIMPDAPVTVRGVFVRVGTVTVKDCLNCTVTLSKSIPETGEKVTVRVIPDEGMEFDSFTITPSDLEMTNNSFIMPDEDVTVSCTCKPKSYNLKWNIDGEVTEKSVAFGSEIIVPDDPEKDGYVFAGWSPEIPDTMPAEDVEFTAVFTPIGYVAKFIADDRIIAEIPYNLDGLLADEPMVPGKIGYIGTWEEYTLVSGGITVNAEYTPQKYKARFAADGVIVGESEYTVETLSLDEPDVPEKPGFSGRWSSYTLAAGGVTVMAVYTSSVHEHTFEAKYSTNEIAHWLESTCEHDVVSSLAVHSFGEGVAVGNAVKFVCTECGYTKIITETEDESAKALALAISSAKDAIDYAAAGGDSEVALLANEAKAEIEELTDASAVTEKLADALNGINSLKTEKAVADALNHLDTVAGAAISADAKAAVNQAKSAILKAEKPEQVGVILSDALEKIDEAEAAEAKIAFARTEAKAEIDCKAGTEQSAIMKKMVDDAKSAVDSAKDEEEIKAVLADSLKLIEKELLAEKENAACPDCGRVHGDSLLEKIICFFVKIYIWLKNLFM